MKHVIIAGFDRCGSSMMCGLLAKHPDISMMFQPTNGTEVHQDMLRPWLPRELHPETFDFFNTLLEDKVQLDYIKRNIFWKHSQCDNYTTAKLNVIKETKCCMKMDWFKQHLPDIALYSIWRKPEEIMYSIVKNGFHMSWYGQRAFDQITYAIFTEPDYFKFIPSLKQADSPIKMMALVVGVSLYQLQLSVDKSLDYHEVVKDPNILNDFVVDFGLDTFDFSEYIKQDFNVSGNDFKDSNTWKTFFSTEDKVFFKRVFNYLR